MTNDPARVGISRSRAARARGQAISGRAPYLGRCAAASLCRDEAGARTATQGHGIFQSDGQQPRRVGKKGDGMNISAGEKIGRLTVLEVYQPRRPDQSRVRCRCDCGAEVDTTPARIRGRNKLSCGCWRKDRLGRPFQTHGLSKTPAYTMFYDARKRALERGLPFDITPQDLDVPSHCPVLGIEIGSGQRDNQPSLDRIIPSRGYVRGNVRVISFRANRIKSDATAEELRAILAYIESAAP